MDIDYKKKYYKYKQKYLLLKGGQDGGWWPWGNKKVVKENKESVKENLENNKESVKENLENNQESVKEDKGCDKQLQNKIDQLKASKEEDIVYQEKKERSRQTELGKQDLKINEQDLEIRMFKEGIQQANDILDQQGLKDGLEGIGDRINKLEKEKAVLEEEKDGLNTQIKNVSDKQKECAEKETRLNKEIEDLKSQIGEFKQSKDNQEADLGLPDKLDAETIDSEDKDIELTYEKLNKVINDAFHLYVKIEHIEDEEDEEDDLEDYLKTLEESDCEESDCYKNVFEIYDKMGAMTHPSTLWGLVKSKADAEDLQAQSKAAAKEKKNNYEDKIIFWMVDDNLKNLNILADPIEDKHDKYYDLSNEFIEQVGKQPFLINIVNKIKVLNMF